MHDDFRCPCDLCNGRLTGAWEDEEDLSWMDWAHIDYGPDPYEGICCACGEEMTPDHTMATCTAPWYWSLYEGPRNGSLFVWYNIHIMDSVCPEGGNHG